MTGWMSGEISHSFPKKEQVTNQEKLEGFTQTLSPEEEGSKVL